MEFGRKGEWSEFTEANSSTLRGRHEQEMSITSRFIEQLNAHMKPAEKLHHLPYFETAGGKKRMFTTDSFRLDTVKKIGEGQFSDTYVVDHKQITDKKFVLKRFKPECDPGIPWKELHAMVYLQHLNICQVLGAFYDDTPTIILEACFGTAKAFCQNLKVKNVIQVTVDVAHALEFMHSKGFIHCDVKPANILIRPSNVAVLTDFGTCMYLNGKDVVKSPGRIGTPYVLNYNALQHLKYSCQTDLWSLACTAFRLQQKERVIPPPSDTDAWTYYANAIRSGVKLNNKIRTFQYCLARCKALYPILKLLTTAGCTAETFIRSRELKTIRSRNKFTAKDDIIHPVFAKEFCFIHSRADTDYPQKRQTTLKYDFATYYHESPAFALMDEEQEISAASSQPKFDLDKVILKEDFLRELLCAASQQDFHKLAGLKAQLYNAPSKLLWTERSCASGESYSVNRNQGSADEIIDTVSNQPTGLVSNWSTTSLPCGHVPPEINGEENMEIDTIISPETMSERLITTEATAAKSLETESPVPYLLYHARPVPPVASSPVPRLVLVDENLYLGTTESGNQLLNNDVFSREAILPEAGCEDTTDITTVHTPPPNPDSLAHSNVEKAVESDTSLRPILARFWNTTEVKEITDENIDDVMVYFCHRCQKFYSVLESLMLEHEKLCKG